MSENAYVRTVADLERLLGSVPRDTLLTLAGRPIIRIEAQADTDYINGASFTRCLDLRIEVAPETDLGLDSIGPADHIRSGK